MNFQLNENYYFVSAFAEVQNLFWVSPKPQKVIVYIFVHGDSPLAQVQRILFKCVMYGAAFRYCLKFIPIEFQEA